MVVIIDNYDSFTFNLALYFEELDQSVVVYKNDQIDLNALYELKFDHLVISPGPCSPDESGISIPAISAFKGRKPILGVCLGHQAIAQQAGASIIRAKHIRHGKTSRVSTLNDSVLFNNCARSLSVTRYHSLIIDPDTLPDSFTVSAWCNDFEDTEIMAIEDRKNRVYGIQFHPESLLTEYGHQMLLNFVQNG
ncbi:anthranilate synthase component II [Glaciecola sp. 1036]|uniref:anthranilate synthase component II n=1 Tax=Alteromonadaceae TaxID=72275 RepID=UPI003D07D659